MLPFRTAKAVNIVSFRRCRRRTPRPIHGSGQKGDSVTPGPAVLQRPASLVETRVRGKTNRKSREFTTGKKKIASTDCWNSSSATLVTPRLPAQEEWSYPWSNRDDHARASGSPPRATACRQRRKRRYFLTLQPAAVSKAG